MNCRWIRTLSLFLAILILFLNLPSSGIRAESVTKFYSVDDKYSYEVETFITSFWDYHANVDLTIKNVGETNIDNWYIAFNSPYNIENIWGASVVDTDDNGT